MLEKVKMALRIKTDKLDTDILDLIESAKVDLSISGVRKVDVGLSLIHI